MLQDFIDAYFECALWSSSTDDDTPMDRDYGIEDISPETLKTMITDAEGFYNNFHQDWDAMNGYSDAQAGHDFWLTRNRHGAGFWDREEIKYCRDNLTRLAHNCGEFTLYIGDDGKIHG